MDEKVIVITGASSGMGKDFALALLKEGHVVYGLARRVEKMADIVAAGGKAIAMDITDESQIQSANGPSIRAAPQKGAGGSRSERGDRSSFVVPDASKCRQSGGIPRVLRAIRAGTASAVRRCAHHRRRPADPRRGPAAVRGVGRITAPERDDGGERSNSQPSGVFFYMNHLSFFRNHADPTAPQRSLLGYLVSTCLVLAGCASPVLESGDQTLTENVTVTTLDGDEVDVALRFSDTGFESVEAIATVEGFDYVLSAADDSKGTSAFAGPVEDPSVYLEVFEAGELSELSVVAGSEAWHSAEDSGDEFVRIARAEPHVRRMTLAMRALGETAPSSKCGPPCIAGWGVFFGGVAAYGSLCASETRVRPLEFFCTETADGTQNCGWRENPDRCEVSYCDKCLRTCLQNC